MVLALELAAAHPHRLTLKIKAARVAKERSLQLQEKANIRVQQQVRVPHTTPACIPALPG